MFWIKLKTAWWFQACFDFHPYRGTRLTGLVQPPSRKLHDVFSSYCWWNQSGQAVEVGSLSYFYPLFTRFFDIPGGWERDFFHLCIVAVSTGGWVSSLCVLDLPTIRGGRGLEMGGTPRGPLTNVPWKNSALETTSFVGDMTCCNFRWGRWGCLLEKQVGLLQKWSNF